MFKLEIETCGTCGEKIKVIIALDPIENLRGDCNVTFFRITGFNTANMMIHAEDFLDDDHASFNLPLGSAS